MPGPFIRVGDCEAIWSLVAVTVVSVKCQDRAAKSALVEPTAESG